MRLTGAVICVRDRDRAVEFYSQLLDLEPALQTPEAVVLARENRDHVVLRVLQHATHVSPSVGVEFLVWTATSRAELDRCVRTLEALDAHVATWNEGDLTVVEGRDPDSTPVLVTFPAATGPGWTSIPNRVFRY
jgi:catechol-2,3-dioxygenase